MQCVCDWGDQLIDIRDRSRRVVVVDYQLSRFSASVGKPT